MLGLHGEDGETGGIVEAGEDAADPSRVLGDGVTHEFGPNV